MNIQEKIAVMQAYADGKPVQIITRPEFIGFPIVQVAQFPEWSDKGSRQFNFEFFEYRVRPEPKEFWIKKPESYPSSLPQDCYQVLPFRPWTASKYIHVREVIPSR